MDDKVLAPFDEEVVLKWFEKYPKLETFIGAGTISLKMAREILGIDRSDSAKIMSDLITRGLLRPTGGATYTPDKLLMEIAKQSVEEV